MSLYHETLHIKSCIAFFNKIEFVALLNVGKFELILHGEYYKHQKDYDNKLQLLFELVDNGTWPIEVKFGNEVSLKI